MASHLNILEFITLTAFGSFFTVYQRIKIPLPLFQATTTLSLSYGKDERAKSGKLRYNRTPSPTTNKNACHFSKNVTTKGRSGLSWETSL
jgi:hypothetical protein